MLVAAPGAQPDESELIERILAGDQAAFEQLYDRYLPRVFGFVQKRLDNRADTEETVQEVFFHVFSCLASYRKEAHFAAWVLGIGAALSPTGSSASAIRRCPSRSRTSSRTSTMRRR